MQEPQLLYRVLLLSVSNCHIIVQGSEVTNSCSKQTVLLLTQYHIPVTLRLNFTASGKQFYGYYE